MKRLRSKVKKVKGRRKITERHGLTIIAVVLFSLMLLPEVGTAQSQIGPPVPDLSCSIPAGPNNFVTVAITKLVEFVGTEIDGSDFSPRNKGDFYAIVTINGVAQNSFNELIEGGSFDFCPGGGFPPPGCILPTDDEILAQYGPNRLWRFSRAFPLEVGVPTRSAVNIRIEIWDDDPGNNPDDMADLKPGPGNEALNLVFNPNTGQVSGDVDSPQGCSMGRFFRSNPVEVCFEISSLPDSDGDGLFDVWEACGFDLDGMAPIDVDFPALRADPRYKDLADPMHKDLFVELDWMTGLEPTQGAIKALKAAFAVAPINAGTEASNLTWGKEDGVGPDPNTCRDGIDNGGDGFTDADNRDCSTGVNAEPNPDGKPGINLWVDTGNLKDASGNLVGDDLGGGNPIDTASNPAPDICAPDDEVEFNSVKKDHFEPGRSFTFRYAISARLCTNEDRAGPNTCMDGKDNGMDGSTDESGSVNDNEDRAGTGSCGDGKDNGGNDGADDRDKDCQGDPECKNISWGEIGGNDFLLRGIGRTNLLLGTIDSPAVIMHELGHNLNLNHGGNVADNCKPNYVSVMNYSHGTMMGIPQAKQRSLILESSSFSRIIDYSPPRFGIEDGAALGSCQDGTDNGEKDGFDADDPDCLKRGLSSFSLKEDMLNESMILDPGTFARLPDRADSVNQFVFTNALKKLVVWPLNGDRDGDGKPDGVDWNGNGRPPLVEDNFGVFTINGKPVPLIQGTCADGVNNDPKQDDLMDDADPDCMHDKMLPPINIDNVNTINDCKKNISTDSELTGFNDWVHISIPFRQFASSADGVVNPPPIDQEPTLEELIQTEQELNTTDLSITKVSAPDTVKVGTDLTYVLTVINIGPNPAGRVEVVDALPEGVSYKSDNAGCVEVLSDEEVPADTLICDLGAMLPYEQREIKITVDTIGTLEGSITNTATVENVVEFAGPDPEPDDNFTTVTTTITLGICGDGTVDSGEDCDDGNILDGDCCSSTCQFEPSGSACGDAGDDCTNQDTCDGAGTCTDNGFKPNGTFCSDGNNCTRTDTCQLGICTGSNLLICGGLSASICGTSDNDNLIGTSLADVIHGSSGDDTINGRGGNDIICGGKGDDTLNGNLGNDRLLGQSGDDTLSGGKGDDHLSGGRNNDMLNGNRGNDKLNGNLGNDNLFGGFGDDAMNGGNGIDRCDGGSHTTEDTANPRCENIVNVP